MSEILIKYRGDFSNIEKFLNNIKSRSYISILEKYGEEGVCLLEEATPKDTGLTSRSWSYEIETTADGLRLCFNNSNIQNGVNVALIIQTGHGTSRGHYVQGRDYISPVMQSIFNKLAQDVLREVN